MSRPHKKRYSRCGTEKSAVAYSRRAANTDGLDAWCKQCHREYGRQHYQNNRDKRLVQCGEYNKSPAGVETRKRTRLRNLSKIRANAYLNNAIKDGRFERGTTCTECGSMSNTEGHHEDYERPLDVVWLCRVCHGRRHRHE